jgi:hypothetical protein
MGTLVFQATLGGAVNIIGPNIANTINFTLPSADGTSGQTWTTNGSGVLAFGTLGIAGGGTGQITATAAFNALAPSQSGQSGKYLTTDGTNTSWGTNPLGTVTSVAATVPSFLSIAGSPITTSGTLAFTLSGTALPTTSGGTGLTSFTSGGVVYASSSSALATGSALLFDGTNMGIGGTPVSSGGYTALTLNNATNSGYVVLQKNASTVSDWYVSGGTLATLRGVGVPLSLEATGANYIKFETNGSEGARLTSTGLGIGTSSPAYKLDVAAVFARLGASGGAGAGLILAGASATKNWVIANQYNVSGALEFTQTTATGGSTISGTPSMVINASGNVGIGTSSPASKLDVYGAIRTTLAADTNYYGSFTNSAGDVLVSAVGTGANLQLQTAGTTRLLVGASGGIQTTTTISVGNATPSTSGAGITFPATQSASSDANTLDDYEEGTWTPTLPNGGTLTDVGSFYTKIGRFVYVTVHLNNIAPTNNGSAFRIGGLPFTASASTGFYGGGSLNYVGDSNLNGYLAVIDSGSTYFFFHVSTGSSAVRTNSDYITAASGSTDSLIINATYMV